MVSVNLYSENSNNIENFLNSFYNSSIDLDKKLNWEHVYDNPIEVSDIIGAFVDNIDSFDITMLLCLDKDIYIHITEENADIIIKYLFERYPY